MKYRSQVHHNGLRPDDTVELAPEQVEEWQGEIDLGFLVPAVEHVPGIGSVEAVHFNGLDEDSAGHARSADDPDADEPATA